MITHSDSELIRSKRRDRSSRFSNSAGGNYKASQRYDASRRCGFQPGVSSLATNPLRKPATYRLSRRAMISSISSQLWHLHENSGGPSSLSRIWNHTKSSGRSSPRAALLGSPCLAGHAGCRRPSRQPGRFSYSSTRNTSISPMPASG